MSVLKRFFNTKRILGHEKHALPFWQGTHFRYAPKDSYNHKGKLSGALSNTTHLNIIKPETMFSGLVKPRVQRPAMPRPLPELIKQPKPLIKLQR